MAGEERVVVEMGREAVVEAMEQGAAVAMGPAVVGTREAVETELVAVAMGPAAVATVEAVAMEPAAVAGKEPAEEAIAPGAEIEPEEVAMELESAVATGRTPAAARGGRQVAVGPQAPPAAAGPQAPPAAGKEERREAEKGRRGQPEAAEREQAAGKEREEEKEGRPEAPA